jgi:hypothetical protein
MLLHTTSDIQLHGYVFGGWKYVFVVYICVEMQPHIWVNVDRLLWVEYKCYIGCI